MDELVGALKAAAEPTRMRILALLATSELNVKDLTLILGQSQPRISRHLKLLVEAGLIERFREGSWVYFHISDRSQGGRLVRRLIDTVDFDAGDVVRDRERADSLKREREAAAQHFFEQHAAEWDRIRAFHVAEDDVERAMSDALGAGPFEFLLDLGTGTGRTLALFADRYTRGLGIDVNQSMLAYARSGLVREGLEHAHVRHGDIYALSLADKQSDAVVMHQVLHFLSDPLLAIREGARVLLPGGRLLIVDFAPHELEFLRADQAHERLGFPHAQVSSWIEDAGLRVLSVQDLAPQNRDGENLIVTLWLAERPADEMTETPMLAGGNENAVDVSTTKNLQEAR